MIVGRRILGRELGGDCQSELEDGELWASQLGKLDALLAS
jgi:hypothetical protein